MLDPDSGARVLLDQRLLSLTLTRDPGVFTFELAPHLCRGDDVLFGGTALAATLIAYEQMSGRPPLWATVQFVGKAVVGDRIECRAMFGARGGYIDQLKLQATVGTRVVFEAVGATAAGRSGGITGTGLRMPSVPAPEDCAPFIGPRNGLEPAQHKSGHRSVTEYRGAPIGGVGAVEDPASLALWARLDGEVVTTPAKLGFLGDMVPIAVCRAAGVSGAGLSLDNSIRIAQVVDSEWVLVQMQGLAAAAGYGYGIAHFWTPDGILLATSSQTAKLLDFRAGPTEH